jgi:hypothetical protein
MKAKEFIIELKKESKPRNFVAKNASLAGKAGQHKDKKKAEKQGDVKHKKEIATMESALSELSTEKLAQYKKAAGADASAVDKAGDIKKADKRFGGIVKATNKQFANDKKGVAEESYGNHPSQRVDPRTGRKYVPPKSPLGQGVAEGERMKTASGMYRDQHTGVAYRGKTGQDGNDSYMTPDYLIQKYQERLAQIASGPYKRPKEVAQLKSRIAKLQGQQGVAEGYQLDEGAIETITALAKKIPGIGKYYQMAQQYKPQLIEILKTSKSGKEVKQKMERLAAGQSATVAESGMMKQLGGLAVGGGSILSTMWMNAMGMIDGVLAKAAAGEVGGAVASGSILGLIPVTLMLFAAMLLFKGSKQSSDEKAQAFQAQRGQQGVAEVAPPGDKAERMVKHIKKGYAKDGKITPKEKSIAYATAWKAHNADKVEEQSVEENKKGVRAVKHTVKPRNFVAKNAVQSGAGAHKDKKKAQKQGDTKHKNKEPAYESKLWTALDRRIIK